MATQHARPADRTAFEIAIICAFRTESDAVEAVFDEFWEDGDHEYGKAPGDPNFYALGRIGRHNVVLAWPPVFVPVFPMFGWGWWWASAAGCRNRPSRTERSFWEMSS